MKWNIFKKWYKNLHSFTNLTDYRYLLAQKPPPQPFCVKWASGDWFHQKLRGPQNYRTDCAGPPPASWCADHNGMWSQDLSTKWCLILLVHRVPNWLIYYVSLGHRPWVVLKCTRTLFFPVFRRPSKQNCNQQRGSLSTSCPLMLPLLVSLIVMDL